MNRRLRFAGVFLALAGLAACARQNETRSTAAPPPPTTLTGAEVEVHERQAPAPRLEVREAEGLPPERVRTMFTSALEPLQKCLPGAPGKLDMRVARVDGAVRFTIQPDPSLDPTARECALQALGTAYMDDTASRVGGPSIPPTNFTSLLSLSW
jgi:hypothetical protein